MGGSSTKEFKGNHLLHFTNFCDNKLYVYRPEHEKFVAFNIFKGGIKFKFFAQETISCPKGSIWVFGGQTLSPELDDMNFNELEIHKHLHVTNFACKINLNKHENFNIDIDKIKPCRVLPEPRTSHLLVDTDSYIYIIGGYVGQGTPTNSCLKFDKQKRSYEEVANIPLIDATTEPAGIAYNDSIYVFETAVQDYLPKVHKFSIKENQWRTIQIKASSLSIPPTVNASIYRISKSEFLILSGTAHGHNDQKAHHYKYDFEHDEIKDLVIENKNNDYWRKENQGNLDYSEAEKVYTRCYESIVRVYDKRIQTWSQVELHMEKPIRESNWCSSSR